jgi:hypothetical protein
MMISWFGVDRVPFKYLSSVSLVYVRYKIILNKYIRMIEYKDVCYYLS